MPRRESGGDFMEALASAMEGKQAEIWTALPAVLESFDASKRTCEVQPTIQARFVDELQQVQWLTLPLLVDCPVMFPGGGGFVLTFPLVKGDEGIVVFSSRCIDAWWQQGEVQVQADLRMHDLSDGFFIPTVRSVPHVEAGISTTDVTLRSVDPGGPMVTLKPDGSAHVTSPVLVTLQAPLVNVQATTAIVEAPEVSISGDVVNVMGVLTINGEPYLDHVHSGIDPGPSNTGGVVT